MQAVQIERAAMLQAVAEREVAMHRTVQNERAAALQTLAEWEAEMLGRMA